jgi:hypothetical protein
MGRPVVTYFLEPIKDRLAKAMHESRVVHEALMA